MSGRTLCRSVTDTRTTSRYELECIPGRRSARKFQLAVRGVSFCSCYIYSPRAEGGAAERSRLLCARLKSGDPEWLPRYAGQVFQQASAQRQFPGLFARDVVLVPVPGSAPSEGTPWAAERLAIALTGVGLAGAVLVCLQRRFAVRKSATALSGERPTVQEHFDSFVAIDGSPHLPRRILLVDDVVTKGRTLLAAAARLHEAFPNTDVRAFALVRTMGFLPKLHSMLEPCEGIIRWAGGDARREP